MNTIETFANAFGVRVRCSYCGEQTIRGSGDSHIYVSDDNRLGVWVKHSRMTFRQFRNAASRLLDAGFLLDSEPMAFSFNPSDKRQCAIAIKEAGIRRRKVAAR